jgi:hypothetical protein
LVFLLSLAFCNKALGHLPVSRRKGSKRECNRQQVGHPALRIYIRKCSYVNFDVCNLFDSVTLSEEEPRCIGLLKKGTWTFVSFSLKREQTWMRQTTSTIPSTTHKYIEKMLLCEFWCLQPFW